MLRDIREAWEPAFAKLLFPAILIQSDDDKSLFGVEVSGRVIKPEMAILPYPNQCDIDGMFLYDHPKPIAFRRRIPFPIDQVIRF